MRAHGIGLLSAIVAVGLETNAAAKDKLEPGEEVSRFALKVINTGAVKDRFVALDRYYGPEAEEPKKAILLTFFATYCEPCKREMPYLEALYGLYREKGLAVVSVSIDRDAEQIEVARKLAETHQISFPMLSDNYNIVAKRYFISQLPCVYIIDGNGRVTFASVGYSDDISRTLLETIRQAIGEPLTDPVPESLAKHLNAHGGDAPADPTAAAGAEETTAPAMKGKGKGKAKRKGKAKGKDRRK